MSYEKVNFYLTWFNYAILGLNSLSGFYQGDLGWGFGYMLALMWYYMYFAMMKSKDKSYKRVWEAYTEVVDFLVDLQKQVKEHEARESSEQNTKVPKP